MTRANREQRLWAAEQVIYGDVEEHIAAFRERLPAVIGQADAEALIHLIAVRAFTPEAEALWERAIADPQACAAAARFTRRFDLRAVLRSLGAPLLQLEKENL